ncbi:MAG TPA: exosortase K [Pyrinomonadaceae bacterium]|nr:exosortase K [Pyrinomonadaceae bacterium]
MIPRISTRQIAQLVVVLTCAWSMKWFYSTATVDHLRWMLWPTTKLVELVTRAQFAFESRAGYMNNEHTFLIAASCAGVNFLITAFVMLGLRKLWEDRNEKTPWRFVPIAAVLAFVATIVTNTVRISLALQMIKSQRSNGWLNAEEAHRLEGILVYFGFLLLLFVAVEEFGRRHRRVSSSRRSRAWRRLTFPLAIYYAMTLGIPFANGAFKAREFWEHSAFVLLIPLVLIAPVILFRLALKKPLRYARLWRASTRDACVPTSLRPRRGLADPTMLSQDFD